MGIAAMDILCCRITIGDADPSNPMRIQNGVEITEVQSLEINESYKKLIGTAKVIFPKGSVCRSTIIGNVTLEVTHFHTASGFFIHPVKIKLCIWNFRLNLKQIRFCFLCDHLCYFFCCSACTEKCH